MSLHGSLSRRSFVSGLIASATLPVWAQSIPSNPDVIVIGAGSAGLAAARTLIAAGKSVVVLEAAYRIGGRAYTESRTFGIPIDHGCSWIMGGEYLPYVDMAKQWQYDLHTHRGAGEALFVDGQLATRLQQRDYNRAWEGVEGAIEDAARDGLDVSASTVIPADMDFAGIPQTWIGPMDWGVDLKDLSTMDYFKYGFIYHNFMVKQGYGTVVARMGAEIPVKLNTPVTRINWGGNGVAVETAAGTVKADACIVTVSTGVLNAQAIDFSPALPEWKQAAIDNLPMGLLAKIFLQFDGETFDLGANRWLSYWVPNQMPAEACYFLTWPFQFNLMVGFVGGEFGWNLSAEGGRAAIDFALNELVKMLGSNARKHFVKGYLTGWASNPLTHGAYSAARPGHYQARIDLARSLHKRLYFAGEAASPDYPALCGGAYITGETAAREVISAFS